MQKIARGTCGAMRTTSSSWYRGPSAAAGSPPSASSPGTVTDGSKATTTPSRTAPASGSPPPGGRNVASFMPAPPYPPRASAFRAQPLVAGAGALGAPALGGRRTRRLGVLRPGEAPAIGVRHLADDQRAVRDLL